MYDDLRASVTHPLTTNPNPNQPNPTLGIGNKLIALTNVLFVYFLAEIASKAFQVTEIRYYYKLPLSKWHLWTTLADVLICFWGVGESAAS